MKSHIASIDRSLGDKSKLDIRKMLCEEIEVIAESQGKSVRYFPNQHYCVAEAIEGLAYERSSEGAIVSQMLGRDLPKAVANVMNQLPADVWKGAIIPTQGSPFKYFFPFVAVEEIEKQQLARLATQLGKALDSSAASDASVPSSESNIKGTDQEGDEFSKLINSKTADNSAAFYATTIMLGLYSSDLDVNIRRIEQAGPLLYMQTMIKFHDIKVSDVNFSTYYLIKEYFLVARHQGLFVITTQIPTGNPAIGSPALVAVNEWLTSFRLAAF